MSEFKKHFRIYIKSGHHSNWKIDPNPDVRRKTPMYNVHAEEKDLKICFGEKLPFNIEIIFIKRAKKKRESY